VGVGKTFIANALAHVACRRNKSVVIIMFRLSRKWTFRPLDLRVYQLPLNA
jgi:hypothetical protein